MYFFPGKISKESEEQRREIKCKLNETMSFVSITKFTNQ